MKKGTGFAGAFSFIASDQDASKNVKAVHPLNLPTSLLGPLIAGVMPTSARHQKCSIMHRTGA
jgi:hypothetical protein